MKGTPPLQPPLARAEAATGASRSASRRSVSFLIRDRADATADAPPRWTPLGGSDAPAESAGASLPLPPPAPAPRATAPLPDAPPTSLVPGAGRAWTATEFAAAVVVYAAEAAALEARLEQLRGFAASATAAPPAEGGHSSCSPHSTPIAAVTRGYAQEILLAVLCAAACRRQRCLAQLRNGS